MRVDPASRSTRLALRKTRFIGGRPDLAIDATWPETHSLPLAFIAQIDLADIAPYSNELPSTGLLSFFVVGELRIDDAVGLGIPQRERLRVLYVPAGTPRRRFDAPSSLPAGHTNASSRPRFHPVDTWPQNEGTLIGERGVPPRLGGLELSRNEWEAWAKRAPKNPASQMLGHPHGLEFPIGADPNARLLLSLDTGDQSVSPDIAGRNGMLFFGIPGDALARREWDRAFHKEW